MHKKLFITILALAVLYCVPNSDLMCRKTASQVKQSGTDKSLYDVSGKVKQGDYSALDRFYDGKVQNKNRAIGLFGKGTYKGIKIATKTLQGPEFDLVQDTQAPPPANDVKDEKNRIENPKFDRLDCKFWIFGCKKMSDVKYGEVSGDLFIDVHIDSTSVDSNDVNQGGLGDCYYMASLAAIARNNPDAISDMVRQNADGTYSVDFYRKRNFWEFWKPEYTRETVTVDSQFPIKKDGSPAFAGYGDMAENGNPEVWAMVLEKAYAKFRGSYNKIGNGGWSGTVLEHVTGKDSSKHKTGSISIDQLAEWDKKGYAVTADSSKDAPNKDVVKFHVYYIMDIDTENKTVTMGNPWGFAHITLSEDEFRKNFSTVYVNPVR
ncbi:MAG: C2 family cysteine protease [bacterium]